MPLYEYQCSKCQAVHEVMQKFSDAPMEACPTCQGPVQKLISRSSFALKGTGWYTTDYKRSSAAPAAAKPDEAAPAAAATPAPTTTPKSTPKSSD